jgi:hypothetical protein
VCIDYGYAPGVLLTTAHLRPSLSTYIGTPISCACCSAACKATLAPLCVKVGNDAVAAADGAISLSDSPDTSKIKLP